jgi:ABC-2 type transport system ATP-binding protein
MDEAAHCNQLAFIYRGRIVAEGTPSALRAEQVDQRIFDISVADADLAMVTLESDPEITEAYLSGASLHAVVPAGSSLTASGLAARLAASGFARAEVAVVEPTIEDVFVNLVSRQR